MTRKFLTLFLTLCMILGCCQLVSAANIVDDPDCTTLPVDNSTTLPDGVYTPDSFSFSGGSGKVTITCPEVVVSDGFATATIVFSSSSYTYVKASGIICYADVVEKTSVFTIPVTLNENNTIYGLTTKMSTPHEVQYQIFVSLAGEGTEIPGLTAEAEIPTDSDAVRIVRYENGIHLLEIQQEQNADAEPSLYTGDTLRYLIIPQEAELPAGLEKEYLVIRQNPASVYADAGILPQLEAKGLSELVRAVGSEDAASDSALYAGASGELRYKILVLQKIELVLADAMPGSEITDRLCTLGLPLLPDFSAEDATAWELVLDLIFG